MSEHFSAEHYAMFLLLRGWITAEIGLALSTNKGEPLIEQRRHYELATDRCHSLIAQLLNEDHSE